MYEYQVLNVGEGGVHIDAYRCKRARRCTPIHTQLPSSLNAAYHFWCLIVLGVVAGIERSTNNACKRQHGYSKYTRDIYNFAAQHACSYNVNSESLHTPSVP